MLIKLSAELVLEDCKEAHRELITRLTGSLWRRRWVACIALLRAVGHVLDKVDSEVCPNLRSALLKHWSDWKEESIFRDFINDERNSLLKEYKFNAGQNNTISFNYKTPKSIITYSMQSGEFTGMDPRELVEKGILWWEVKLQDIKKDL